MHSQWSLAFESSITEPKLRSTNRKPGQDVPPTARSLTRAIPPLFRRSRETRTVVDRFMLGDGIVAFEVANGRPTGRHSDAMVHQDVEG